MLSLLLTIRIPQFTNIRMLSLSKIIDYADCVLPFENKALLDIYQKILSQCSNHRPGASTATTIADNGDRVFTKTTTQPKAFDTMVHPRPTLTPEQHCGKPPYEHNLILPLPRLHERRHIRHHHQPRPFPIIKVPYFQHDPVIHVNGCACRTTES
jgi:hypothetical protein